MIAATPGQWRATERLWCPRRWLTRLVEPSVVHQCSPRKAPATLSSVIAAMLMIPSK